MMRDVQNAYLSGVLNYNPLEWTLGHRQINVVRCLEHVVLLHLVGHVHERHVGLVQEQGTWGKASDNKKLRYWTNIKCSEVL